MRATADAVHAHEALGFAPGKTADGIVSALTMEQAAVAFVAGGGVFVQAEDRPPGDGAEQSSERADGAAPEACDAQAGEENGEEENTEEQALGKVLLAEVEDQELKNTVDGSAGGLDGGDVAVLKRREDGADGEVESGQDRQAEGAN